MKRKITAIFALAMTTLPAGAATTAEDFAPCDDARGASQLAGSLCARFDVPLERGTPGGEKITLFLRQFPSKTASLGQVWLVAGESGEALYPVIGAMRMAFPGYDLIVPDRRGSGRSTGKGGASVLTSAHDLQAEIDRYSRGGSTLLYGASHGSEVVLKALPLVRPRRVAAVILDSPPPLEGPAAPLSVTSPGASQNQPLSTVPWDAGQAEEPGLDTSLPRTLILRGDVAATPPGEIEPHTPVTTYIIEGAPNFLMLTVPECAAPLVRGFVQGEEPSGAPCAGKLSIRF